MQGETHYSEIDIVKGIGIFLVVVGHAVPDANTGIQNFFWGGVFHWIYSFHMALFMTMSGVLFYSKAIRCISASERREEIRKRAIRLLLPYSFYSFSILVAKIIFYPLSRNPVSIWSVIEILFGDSPCGNMWFLWSLFVISSIILLVPKTKNFPIVLCVIALVAFFYQDLDIGGVDFGLSKICNMLIWFSLGMLIGRHIGVFAMIHERVWLEEVVIISVFTVQILLLRYGLDFLGGYFLKLLCAVLGIVLVIFCSSMIDELKGKTKEILKFAGKNSMCIYVFSYFVQTPLVTVYRKMGDCGVPYDVWVIASIVLSLLFTTIVTRVVRKNKVLKLVLLGER